MEKVVRKETEPSWEAGGGKLYIPILGDLFPKRYSQEPKETLKYFIITETTKYQVEKENYEKLNIGDEFDEKMDIFY